MSGMGSVIKSRGAGKSYQVHEAVQNLGEAFSSSAVAMNQMSKDLYDMQKAILKAMRIPEEFLQGDIDEVKASKEAKYTVNFEAPSFSSIEATGPSHVEKPAFRVEDLEDESGDDFMKSLGARETVGDAMIRDMIRETFE